MLNNVSLQGMRNFVEQNPQTTAALVGASLVATITARYFWTRPPLIDQKVFADLDLPDGSRGKSWTESEGYKASQPYKWSWRRLSWIPDGSAIYSVEDVSRWN